MALIISSIKYLAVFIVALFFFKISEQCYSHYTLTSQSTRFIFNLRISKQRLIGFLCALIGILMLSLFAGLRAKDVGVDTSGYPETFMRIASGSRTFSDFISNCSDVANEPLGALLVYFCSRITKNTGLLLFSYQFLTVTLVYFAALKLNKKISICDSMAIYLFLFFNNSLNMMRQSVGCAFIFYGMAMLMEQKRFSIKAIVAILIALLFHKSSIYGIILVLPVYLSFSFKKNWIKYGVYAAVLCMPVLLNSISSIVRQFTNDAHILYYLDVFISGKIERDWFVNPFSLYSIVYILVALGTLALPYIFRTSVFGKTSSLQIDANTARIITRLRTMNMVGFLIYIVVLFSMKTMYGMRFSIFFDYFYMLSIPLSIGNNKNKRMILYSFLIIVWFIWIMRMGWSGSSLYHMSI